MLVIVNGIFTNFPFNSLVFYQKYLSKNKQTICSLFRRKSSNNQEMSMTEMVRQFLSGYGLDDALALFGLAGQNENDLPT